MKKKLSWPETLLLLNLTSQKISDDLQDELLEIRNDSSGHDLLWKNLSHFCVSMQWSYAKISMATFEIITPFVSTYLCKHVFFKLVQIKTKVRNKL